MIIYLCNGQDPKCKASENCNVNNPTGLCKHTTNHLYSKNDPEIFAEALKNPNKWEKTYGAGDTPNYWEKEEGEE